MARIFYWHSLKKKKTRRIHFFASPLKKKPRPPNFGGAFEEKIPTPPEQKQAILSGGEGGADKEWNVPLTTSCDEFRSFAVSLDQQKLCNC